MWLLLVVVVVVVVALVLVAVFVAQLLDSILATSVPLVFQLFR